MNTSDKNEVTGGGKASRGFSIKQTPWGYADNVATFGSGANRFYFASTPSHGGFYVPDTLIECISEEGQRYAKHWSGDRHWFEEDCAYCFVVTTFPQFFSDEVVQDARHLVEYIVPNRLP